MAKGHWFDIANKALFQAATRREIARTLAVLLPGLPLGGLAGAADKEKKGRGEGKGAGKRRAHQKRQGKDRGDRDRGGNRDRRSQRRGRAKRGNLDASRRGRIYAQAASAICYPGSPCIPGTGANLVGCDFGDSSELKTGCRSCDLSKANLEDAIVVGADLSGADLSDACLVDADFSGGDLTGATTSGAIFCRTIMPDGSIDNSGCASGTDCCQTCQEIGGACGLGLGGDCCGGATCVNGVCTCPVTKPHECGGFCQECCVNGQCPSNVCCANACCTGSAVCDTRADPDICCTPDPPHVTCAGRCGTVTDNCGQPVACPTCSNPTPICGAGNVCEPCTSGGQCGAGSVCCGGACLTGVCCEDAQCAPTGNTCVGNECFCGADRPCPGEKPDCCGVPGTCTTIDADPANCGTCGAACPTQTAPVCVHGQCGCHANGNQPCGPAQTCCDDGCYDLQSDPNNCGACGNSCAAAEVCSAAICVCPASGNQPCGPGLTCCASGCEDLTTNWKNCGACDAACPIGGTCQAGVCVCPAGEIACGGQCVLAPCCATGQPGMFCGNQCVTGICCELGETCATVSECCANNRPGAPQNRVCCRNRIGSTPGTECCLRTAAIGEPPTPCRNHSDCCGNRCIGGRCRGGLRSGGPDCYP